MTQPKAAPKPAPRAHVTKGAQAKADLGRKAWNRTVTAKARLMGRHADGRSVYAHVTDAWVDVQAMRAQGMTPDEVLAKLA